MAEPQREESEQNVLDTMGQSLIIPKGADKSSAASPLPSERRGNIGRQHLENYLATQTPEKATETSQSRHNKAADKLPDKYKVILELFDRLICSLRLIGLRKKPPTFRNICKQVEILTGRKFEYKHLAQIKQLLPEAIQICMILVHDAETMCMTPEIQITLLLDVVEGHAEHSIFIALSHLFATRLTNFLAAHPEAGDLPEAILPEQFIQASTTKKLSPFYSSFKAHVNVSTSTSTERVKLSDLCSSFKRRFSQKAVGSQTEKTRLLVCPLSSSSITGDNVTDQAIENPRISLDSPAKFSTNRSSVQATIPQLYETSSTCQITPTKSVTESDDLTLETPAQSTPKRSLPTCEDKHKTIINLISTARNQTAKRSLDFATDDEESSLNFNSYEVEQNITLPNSSAQIEITGKSVKDGITAFLSTLCKDETRNCFNAKGNKSFQGCLATQQQTSVCLSDLVLTIHQVFQSVNWRSITKKELVHKIIMNNCDIDDKCDIEEQIEHLEKLVPDWIHKTFSPCGDFFYNIKMVSDLNSVRDRVISV